MNIVIKPKNYNEAFHFYVTLPFYGFKDLIYKNEIIFNDDQIVDIRIDNKNTYVNAFSYNKNGFVGILGLGGCSQKLKADNFSNKKIVPGIKTGKELINYIFPILFNKYSPPLWHLIITFLVFGIFFIFHKVGFLSNNIGESIYCDKFCLKDAYDYFFSFAMMLVISILGILICWYLAFICTKKVRDANIYGSIKASAIILIIVNVLICSKAITRIQDPRFHVVYNLVTNPNLNHEQNKREIASAKEFLIEVKKQKNR